MSTQIAELAGLAARTFVNATSEPISGPEGVERLYFLLPSTEAERSKGIPQGIRHFAADCREEGCDTTLSFMCPLYDASAARGLRTNLVEEQGITNLPHQLERTLSRTLDPVIATASFIFPQGDRSKKASFQGDWDLYGTSSTTGTKLLLHAVRGVPESAEDFGEVSIDVDTAQDLVSPMGNDLSGSPADTLDAAHLSPTTPSPHRPRRLSLSWTRKRDSQDTAPLSPIATGSGKDDDESSLQRKSSNRSLFGRRSEPKEEVVPSMSMALGNVGNFAANFTKGLRDASSRPVSPIPVARIGSHVSELEAPRDIGAPATARDLPTELATPIISVHGVPQAEFSNRREILKAPTEGIHEAPEHSQDGPFELQ